MKYVYIEAWHHYCRTELELEGRTSKYLHYQLSDAYATNAPNDAVHKKLVFDNNSYSPTPPKWNGEWITVRDLILHNIWKLDSPILQEFLAYSSDRMLFKALQENEKNIREAIEGIALEKVERQWLEQQFKQSAEAHKKANHEEWDELEGVENNIRYLA